ncbi:GNAT family N-acetyltransferase [Desulfitobacterium sp.]|uniref:GNAT family N-acetyltransferase n=1 Tax=Desulfitobacterium sp. TaxID=49981 RepID=UPI002B1FB678|nr:GNAT family N-acetyltransferase [Desulfitobacterium sp.]MEA4903037.1 GNAT family N-acetyltransferase [Desulfitobacterium sp.]
MFKINKPLNPMIKLRKNLERLSYTHISNLQKICLEHDGTVLKLELDYKLGRAEGKSGALKAINEFMYYDDDTLVGYIGICDFGGDQIEVNGMVHPEYRRKGIFKSLFSLVKDEWSKRKAEGMLLLSDRDSFAGQEFIKGIPGSAYNHTEYEMFIKNKPRQELNMSEVVLRKATNCDAREIARQNAIYFGEEFKEEGMLIPEEEEKCGMIIYLAEVRNNVIGKVHLDVSASVGGIYGLGVLPECRGKGYGRGILTQAIQQLIKKNFKGIMLQVNVKNENALNLYRSCGFEVTSTMDYYELKKDGFYRAIFSSPSGMIL